MADAQRIHPKRSLHTARVVVSVVVLAVVVGVAWKLLQRPVAVPVTAGPTAGPAAGRPWQPLQVGASWEYDQKVQRITQMEGQPERNNIYPGSLHVTVDQLDGKYRGRGPAVDVESRETEEGHLGAEVSFHIVTVFAQDNSGLYTHATWNAPLRKDSRVLEYHPPLQWLPFPAQVGAKWTVGEYEDIGNHIGITGEILGIEDLETPAGAFAGCLKVRYIQVTKGTILVQRRRMPLKSDVEEHIWWYAPGVGPVKQVNTVTREFETPLGKQVSTVFTTTRVLKSHQEQAAPPPAAAAPEQPPAEGGTPLQGPSRPAPKPPTGKGP